MQFRDTLIAFQELLSNFCQPIFKILEKPLTNSEVETFLDNLNFDNKIIKEIYLWKNDVSNDGTMPTQAYAFCNFGFSLLS